MEDKDILLRNNTGNKSKSAIIDGFVVRTSEFDQIRTHLEVSKALNDIRNTIIIGQRGAGKTTLMHRLAYAILDQKNLSDRYLPILFSEEQYNLSDLTNLWEAIAVVIEENFYKENLTSRLDEIIEIKKDYEKESFQLLQQFLTSKDKIAILFIENINFFLRKLSEAEKKRFKSILTSDFPFRIIGSSTSYSDATIDFGNPFYDFLDLMQLDGLTQEECEKLLIKIGQQYGEEDQIKEVISNYPGRIEALRRLTGGVPRTISYLFQIFLDNENGKAIKDLYLLIDTLTLLYKSELDQLSTQQQKVIDAIARKWDAISVKEITKRTRLESKNVSSILSYLEKNQLVEKVHTSTKNHLYRIKDRFMNIWYLMRFGRKHDKDNVIWLVRFFDAWCDESELTKRLKKHISNLKDGKYDAIAAIDMGNTFLSCENIPDNLKEELITTTNSMLPDRLLKHAKNDQTDVLEDIKKLLNDKKFDEAVARLSDLKVKNLGYYMLATSAYLMQGDLSKALETANAASALDDQNSFISVILGIIHEFHFKDYDTAITYYEKCLTQPRPHPYAANRLGDIFRDRKEYEKALKYHMQAASKNFKQSLRAIADIYIELNQFEQAERYLRDAIKSNVEGVYTSLAKVLTKLKRRKEAETALQQAVLSGEENANVSLGKFYLTQKKPNFNLAEIQFKQAIEKGELDAYNHLARIYIKRRELAMGIKIYEEGVAHGIAECAHQLGHVHHKREAYEKADEMFNKAIELGDNVVAVCWAQSIFHAQRGDKKQFTKELLDKYRPKKSTLPFELLYAKILLWNDDILASSTVVNGLAGELNDVYNEESESNRYNQRVLSGLAEYFILLIAKKEYQIALEMFNDSGDVDYKAMLKPVYYLLMDELKDQYPIEYLKAGKELTETINDLKKEVKYLREK